MPDSEAARWGRLIFTRGGYQSLQPDPGADLPDAAGGPPGFRAEFDEYFRALYARAVAQAQDFVSLVAPESGSAVVECACGNGRITFDGGLAERIGPTGQLLITDPSVAQLHAAARRAQRLGITWVRALQARAEELPLASGIADLAIGAVFLHFTAPARAIAEMGRIVRPGGRVAINNPLPYRWPDAWRAMMEPIRAELARHDLPMPEIFPTADSLLQHFADSGLVVERCEAHGPEFGDYPSDDLAIAFWRTAGLVDLFLKGVPAARHSAVWEAFEPRVREVFARTTPEERRIKAYGIMIVARRPE